MVDKEKKCIKIHFVGYGNEYVGWRDLDIDSDQLLFVRLKKNYVPDVESFEDRKQMFHDNLYRAIKRKLWSGWKAIECLKENYDTPTCWSCMISYLLILYYIVV